MGNKVHSFKQITKSKFLRSVFLQVLGVFVGVSVAIVAIVFFSFATEISQNIVSERRKQLAVIEQTISKRVNEITSISYSVANDPTFFLEPVEETKYTGYEMSNTLKRYLAGNSFVEQLAYYRLSEPDKIYVSSGERSFSEFWSTNLGISKEQAKDYIDAITSVRSAQIVTISMNNDRSFFSYVCPLPQMSPDPQAFVLMLIPTSEVTPLLSSQLVNSEGKIAVFDGEGNEIYRIDALDEKIPMNPVSGEGDKEEFIQIGSREYVKHTRVSPTNGWTYVSVIRLNDIIEGLANRQLVFIVLMAVLMLAAVAALIICIMMQYKPISNLADTLSDRAKKREETQERQPHEIIDERQLLSETFATLADDSAQKQHFESAYREAQAANKAKSAFLSSVSHDIRTPMNAIIGMTSLASERADDPAYVTECLGKVQVASRYLLDIINNVLDMSKIESGKFTLSQELVELPELISGLEAILSQSILAKHQRFVVEVGDIRHDRVLGDNVRLTQVFVNILSNAVKFTPDGGVITFRARETACGKDGFADYVFSVEDTGIGMPPEFVAQVFDAFSRAPDAKNARVEGTGLGMAIAKNLVEMMGGTISCESELDKGTTFTLSLHMKLASEQDVAADGGTVTAAQAASLTQPPDLTGMRVLVAEDNDINREIAQKIIEKTNAEVTQVQNGREALDAFLSSEPYYFDVILMDLQMPVMDGFETASAIRACERSDAASVPIYAMTANIFDEDVRSVREAGMNGHLGKPYTPSGLYRILALVRDERHTADRA